MSNASNNTVEAPETSAKNTSAMPDFGNGRYSPIMQIAYKDAIRVIGLAPEKAELYAKAFGADLGQAKVSPTEMSNIKFGKVDKDGYTKIRETAKSTAVKFSYSFELNKFIRGLDDLRGSIHIEPGKPYYEVKLAEHLENWLSREETNAK